MLRQYITFLSCAIIAIASVAQTTTTNRNDILISLLGEMPKREPLKTDTLEYTALDGGNRYKIRYFIEAGNPALDTPDDWATHTCLYLLSPKGKKPQPLLLCIRMTYTIISVSRNLQG